MAILTKNRSKLLLGAGSMALAMALTLAPERARAQRVQATEDFVVGAGGRSTFLGTDTITVASPVTVIDWTPDEDAIGNALDFLPNGVSLVFENDLNSPDFAVLNRILPSTNGNVAVLDGAVIAQYFDFNTQSVETGGTIAFYSPTGLLIGSNATFDVGSLILTSIEPSLASFTDFTQNGGTLILGDSSVNSTSSIIINDGAQINAPLENSFFIAAGPEVQMLGQSTVNGSQAFIGGNFARVTVTNGLFDIQIPVGTEVTTPIVIDGDVGGPASIGAADNHIIYAVAKALNDPISMIFRGNLGFDPAVSAGVVNGEVILSANYDVQGRTVQDGTSADGINAVFSQPDDVFSPPPAGSIFLEDFTSTSSILAIANEEVQVTALNANSSVDGNLLMVGRNFSELTATNGNSLTVSGDVLVSARSFGVRSSSLPDPTVINAQGGTAFIDAFNGGLITIQGDALVTADAFGGENDVDGFIGDAFGGSAQLGANGGTLDIAGNVAVSANGFGVDGGFGFIGGEMRGGLAQVFADQGGVVNLGGALDITADAVGPNGTASSGAEASDVFGGQALLNILADGGSITVALDTFLSANAIATFSSNSLGGAIATGGEATVAIQSNSTIDLQGELALEAEAEGGSDDFGQGGEALGGIARAFTDAGGTLSVAGDFSASANAQGGDGTSGGQARGGFAGARAIIGFINLLGRAGASATGQGGAAFTDLGGTGGNGLGGTALFQAEGTLADSAEIRIAQTAVLDASGRGGRGGLGDSFTPAGTGGEGRGGNALNVNPVLSNFNNGAYLLAGGDNGTISVGDVATVSASGQGGDGGDAFGVPGGQGGAGFGGSAFVGTSLFTGLNGSVGNGSVTLTDVNILATGDSGGGGIDAQSSSIASGPSGDGTGGDANLFIDSGSVTAGRVVLAVSGDSAAATSGGEGIGGTARIRGSLDGIADLAQLSVFAFGSGGSGNAGLGGLGAGGLIEFSVSGIDVTISGNAEFDAGGIGGSSTTGDGADGTGGTISVGAFDPEQGSLQVDGNVSLTANGFGGEALGQPGSVGGTGQGGTVRIFNQSDTTIQLNSAQLTAGGSGGNGPEGGSGIGGTASIEADGISSIITIIEDVPSNVITPLNEGAILSANGIGANAQGPGQNGGDGTGGTIRISAINGAEIELPALPSVNSQTGALRLIAQGRGGSSVDGGIGGDAIGGTGDFVVLGGTLTMGRTEFSVLSSGGTGQAGNTNSDATGGGATGGLRGITIENGGTLNVELTDGGVESIGGNGAGAGAGGSASAGSNSVTVLDGVLNVTGDLVLAALATGGSGGTGGSVVSGEAMFRATNSDINFTSAGGDSRLIVEVTTQGGQGDTQGGSSESGSVDVSILNSTFDSATILASSNAIGGLATGTGGEGGAARSGNVFFRTNPSEINVIGQILIASSATGGSGDVLGGEAFSGDASAQLDGTDITITAITSDPTEFIVSSEARSGDGAQGGAAVSGRARALFTNSTLSVDDMNLSSFADAVTGGTGAIGGGAQAGDVSLEADDNALIQAINLSLRADAITNSGVDAAAGTASISIGAGGGAVIQASNLFMNANAAGAANSNNAAGGVEIELLSGTLIADDVDVMALGDIPSGNFDLVLINALGGSFIINNQASFEGLSNITINTGNSRVVGGGGANLNFDTSGLITIDGDGTGPGVEGLSIFLQSNDIEIGTGGSLTGGFVFALSSNTNATAQIGGATNGLGYTLTQAELSNISTDDFTFEGVSVNSSSGPNAPDILLLDANFQSIARNSVAIFGANGSGIVRVEGNFGYFGGAGGDINIFAGQRLEVVTPGSLQVVDDGLLPQGAITLDAENIWVADAALIAQLQADPQFTGRNALLQVAAAGSDDPFGYIRANDVTIGVGQSLLVRNTGTAFEPGGITIGDQTGNRLSIGQSLDPLSNQELDVFAYGRQQLTLGGSVTGEDFFNLVLFNQPGLGGFLYTAESEFNDCVINTATCNTPPPPPPSGGDVGVVTNPEVVKAPVEIVEVPPANQQQVDAEFGVDFPGLVEAPLLTEDPLLEDPVASGGDSTLYAADEVEDGSESRGDNDTPSAQDEE